MWKFNRSFVLPRWYASNQWLSENKNQNPILSRPVITPISKQNRYSDESHNKKERFKKQSERFWKCSQFQYLLSKSFLYDTAGWVGTATILCLKFHHTYFNSFVKNGKEPHCTFSRNVLAIGDNSSRLPCIEPQNTLEFENAPSQHQMKTNHASVNHESSVEDFHQKATQYEAMVYNSSGLACLDTDSKKAFRNFQKAARLGSSQGLFNLGLCYELGKGTRVNLSRAAFCFRKAALKGHGLASFNLAIYFMKGLGGLPVDPQAAKLLLAAAAEQDIPQAQLLMGLEYLEEEKWSDAYEIFEYLAKKDNLDGKYYLGMCLENGWGVNKNMIKAAAIYSQNSALGHSKSTLKLSRFYEEGLGGCDLDLDLAMALCQISADKEDEDGKEALTRLKAKREKHGVKNPFQINLPLHSSKPHMHSSNSLPEFASFRVSSIKPAASIFSYLDLVTSFPLQETKEMKSTFYIGDDLNISSSSVISCSMS